MCPTGRDRRGYCDLPGHGSLPLRFSDALVRMSWADTQRLRASERRDVRRTLAVVAKALEAPGSATGPATVRYVRAEDKQLEPGHEEDWAPTPPTNVWSKEARERSLGNL